MLERGGLAGYLDRWDRKATVRALPHHRLPEVRSGLAPFPRYRQPISIHPLVIEKGERAVRAVLLQSCYKYMEDIALTETEIVCSITTRIANGRMPYASDATSGRISLTVMTDEAYHAHVARDFVRQLTDITETQPIAHPRETELSVALAASRRRLSPELADDFDLLAVAIAENTLTREIVDLRRDPGLDDAFLLALSNHLLDEAQHSAFFQHFLRLLWPQIPEERQAILGEELPRFLSEYLGVAVQKRFDAAMLESLGFAPSHIAGIIEDTHEGHQVGPAHPMVRNIVGMLASVGVLGHARTRAAFVSAGLAPA